MITPKDVIAFWTGLPQEAHFGKDDALDAEITERFADALQAARQGELDDWPQTPEGGLALVILLDQFSRNIHRGSPDMFAGDAKALAVADKLLRNGMYKELPAELLCWLVIPFMHSEKLADQERCVALCDEHGLEETAPYAIEHADIIRKFGRFPHRNTVLNRAMRPDEQAFLDEGGFAG